MLVQCVASIEAHLGWLANTWPIILL